MHTFGQVDECHLSDHAPSSPDDCSVERSSDSRSPYASGHVTLGWRAARPFACLGRQAGHACFAIEPAHVVRRLVGAATTIGPRWEEHLALEDGDRSGDYIDISVLAFHVVDLMEHDRVYEIEAIFQQVEQLLRGDELTRGAINLVVVGLLEDVQTITGHDHIPVRSSEFARFLGPSTLLAWIELHGHWGSEDT